jgi:hypothetical protein
MHVRTHGLTFALSVVALIAASREAYAQSKAACNDSYVEAQKQRRAGKLLDARERLRVCMEAACPEFERVDCGKWLDEVTASLPTVVFAAIDAGHDVQDARIEVDGVAVANRTSGRAVEIDPGDHVVRAVLTDGRTRESRVTILQGQKDRIVEITFAPVEPPRDATRPIPVSPAPRPVPFLVYPLAAVGVAGLATFAGFAFASSSKRSSLEDRCAPVCTDAQVSSVRTLQIVADVSLIVGAASLVAAGFFYFTRPERRQIASNAASR